MAAGAVHEQRTSRSWELWARQKASRDDLLSLGMLEGCVHQHQTLFMAAGAVHELI